MRFNSCGDKYLVVLLLGVSLAGAQLIEMLKPLDDSPNQQHSTRRPLGPSNTKPTPTTKFQHEFQLDPDGNFWLFWNISGKNVTFVSFVRYRKCFTRQNQRVHRLWSVS